jgi:hypothetical protein
MDDTSARLASTSLADEGSDRNAHPRSTAARTFSNESDDTIPIDGHDGVSSVGWFKANWGNKHAVSWDTFWNALQQTVYSPGMSYERAQYDRHSLGTGPPRRVFRSFFSTIQMPGSSSSSDVLTRDEFIAISKLTSNGKLGELIDMVMSCRWSDWQNGGQDLGEYSEAVLAKAGA